MKLMLLFLLIGFTVPSFAALDEILILAKNEPQVIKRYAEKIRKYLLANQGIDPYDLTFDQPIEIPLKKGSSSLINSQSWIDSLLEIIGINWISSEATLELEKLSYNIEDFQIQMNSLQESENRYRLLTRNIFSGTNITAESLNLNIYLAVQSQSQPIKLSIQIKDPSFQVDNSYMDNIHMNWLLSMGQDTLEIELTKINIFNLISHWKNNPHKVNFTVGEIILPEVEIKIGKKLIKIDPERVENYIMNSLEDIKLSTLEYLFADYGDELAHLKTDSPLVIKLNKFQPIKGDKTQTHFKLENIDWEKDKLIYLWFSGEYCLANPMYEGCQHSKPDTTYSRKISREDELNSMTVAKDILLTDQGSIVLSVNVDYFNRLFEVLHQVNSLNENLEHGFKIGPRGIMGFSQIAGHSFQMYVDVIYPLTGASRIILRRRELRFPVSFNVNLKVEMKNNIPFLQIDILENTTTEKLLLEGAKSLGFPSYIGNMKLFKKKVLKKIHSELNDLKGTRILDWDMPFLKGVELSDTLFYSDGSGRALGIIRDCHDLACKNP